MIEALLWLTTIASLTGVILNIRKRVACFYVWAVTNAIWAAADMAHGLYSQAVLQAIYFCLALYGIRQWSRKGESRHVHTA